MASGGNVSELRVLVTTFFVDLPDVVASLRGLLVGERAAPEKEEKITKAALSIREVKEAVDLKTMQIGLDKLLVDIEVNVQDDPDTDQIEALTDKIKARLTQPSATSRWKSKRRKNTDLAERLDRWPSLNLEKKLIAFTISF